MSDYIMPDSGFEPCPDPWAALHVFYHPELKKVIPARCKKWSCFSCAKINYYKVDYLLSAGNPERFITLTRAGDTTERIRLNLQHLIQSLRRKGYVFEYAAIVELHRNGQAHLHLLQRGDFIPQRVLSKIWHICTSKGYQGKGSSIVDIRSIEGNQNVKGYVLKYLKKTWEQEKHNPKSWFALQEKYPGLNHYRMSKNWLPGRPGPSDGWKLIPKVLLDVQNVELDPINELFFTDTLNPLSPVKELAIQSRKKVSRA
jgi:hypothetical protein